MDIKERSKLVAEKIIEDNWGSDSVCLKQRIAEAIFEEFRCDYHVVIVTKGGVAGEYADGDRVRCEKALLDLENLRKSTNRHPDCRVSFDPFGMGMGAPCPIDAIEKVLLLKPGEKLPLDVLEPAMECAVKFHEALDKGGSNRNAN